MYKNVQVYNDKIKNNVLNSVYNKYRWLVRYSEDYVKQMYVSDILENCLACEVTKQLEKTAEVFNPNRKYKLQDAERIMITMDGNFQMKRLDDKSQEELPVDGMFSLSVSEKSL